MARTSLETFTDLLLGTQIRGGGVLANRVADISNAITSRTNEDGKTTGLTWHPRYSARDPTAALAGARARVELGLHGVLQGPSTQTSSRRAAARSAPCSRGRDQDRACVLRSALGHVRLDADGDAALPGVGPGYMTQTGAVYDVEAFVQRVKQDPLFLVKNSREEGGFSAHRAGMNRVAQIRSLKATTLGKAFTSPINAMTQGKLAYNFLGHLLKIPFQFASFTSNAIITITGLGGIDQILAMYLDGKDKPGFMNRMSAHVRGEAAEGRRVRHV